MVMGEGGGKEGPGEEGREEGRRAGEGGSAAEASHSKGFLVPRGACCFGAVPACRGKADRQDLQGGPPENATSQPS